MFPDSFPQNSKWQQGSSCVQDTSQYSDTSQQYCSLDGLHSSSYFQVLQSLYQYFGNCNKHTNNNWYHCYLHILHFFFFSSLARYRYLSLFWIFSVLPYGQPERQSPLFGRFTFFFSFFFFGWLSLDLVIWPRLGDLMILHF